MSTKRDTARSDIDHMSKGGGFILTPGCSLPYTPPDDNVSALMEAAKEYGQYQ